MRGAAKAFIKALHPTNENCSNYEFILQRNTKRAAVAICRFGQREKCSILNKTIDKACQKGHSSYRHSFSLLLKQKHATIVPLKV